VTEGTGPKVTLAMRRLARALGRLDDGYRAWGPEVMALAQNTLRIQLVILRMELEGYIVLFLVGHHQIQVFATGAAYESGLARIESQNVHTNPTLWMRDFAASLLVHQAPIDSKTM